jgi:hypothetical protein
MRAPVLAIAAAMLCTTGCGTLAYWTKPGATDADFYRDTRECAESATPRREATPGVEKIHVNKDLYRACMMERGYRRGEYSSPPPVGWRPVLD